MKRTLLIDGDIVVYQYSATVEREIDWGDDVWSMWADAKEAKQLILQYLDLLVEQTAADDLVFCFSDKDNFRKTIDPSYKSNRKGKRKPIIYSALVEWAKQNYRYEQWRELEADDVMGILATTDIIEGEKVIVSEDKDMKTIPCLLWRGGEMHTITEQEADYNHLLQTLVGDATDGYPGCPGIGATRAPRILDENPTWATVVDTYKKAKLTEKDALLQGRLARILRASDYNFEYDQPKEWTPIWE